VTRSLCRKACRINQGLTGRIEVTIAARTALDELARRQA
jgi:hypothetical protein